MLQALVLGALALLPLREDPHRQFDFWVGEWQVQNRHMQPDGTWVDGDVTRARITPVCGGKAILEEWAGPFRGGFQNGFSLRAYDPADAQWRLVLFWTMNGRSTFGLMTGTFRHGRGQFGGTTGANRTRYTFSDALPDSVRWDSSTTKDGGLHWKTDWIMEFSRTRAAGEVTQAELFAADWNAGTIAPSEARALDGLLGTWSGSARDQDGNERRARLTSRLLNKDCLVLDVLEIEEDEGDWNERLCVRGFESNASPGWTTWRVAEDDTRLRRFSGTPDGDSWVFRHVDPSSGAEQVEFLTLVDEGTLVIEESRRASRDAELEVHLVVELARP